MLRVGLTGGLASGKSTVASLFARRGVHILNADQIGRELMQPGQPVYGAVLAHFRNYPDAPRLTLADGQLDRSALARYVLSTGKLDELSRIVHPPVVAEQERRMQFIFAADPDAIVMVESALIFEADRGKTAPGLSQRFDKLILVTAPEELRVARYTARGGKALSAEELAALEEDGRKRMAKQMTDQEKAPLCDFVIENSGSLEHLEAEVEIILKQLQQQNVRQRNEGATPATR
ncbi:MAG TPA: dephospho-CoA kinase [Acidobacteriaceae bacterium]|nr:dephospho-CoA kinase [Acidobacteriaceae bacterium]